MIKLGKVKPDISEFNLTSGRGNMSDGRIKHSIDGMINQVGIKSPSRGERTYLGKQSVGSSDAYETGSRGLPRDFGQVCMKH